LVSISAIAQERKQIKVETVPPLPEDVATIDGVMKAFYEVISGPAGQPRQWSRDRSLYIPDVRFVSIEKRRDGTIEAQPISHQEFVDRSDAGLVKNGFYESEIHRETQQFGQIAHVFSTYEMRIKQDGPLIGRGINSSNYSTTANGGGCCQCSGTKSVKGTRFRKNGPGNNIRITFMFCKARGFYAGFGICWHKPRWLHSEIRSFIRFPSGRWRGTARIPRVHGDRGRTRDRTEDLRGGIEVRRMAL